MLPHNKHKRGYTCQVCGRVLLDQQEHIEILRLFTPDTRQRLSPPEVVADIPTCGRMRCLNSAAEQAGIGEGWRYVRVTFTNHRWN